MSVVAPAVRPLIDQAADLASSTRVVVGIVNICHEAGDLTQLNAQLVSLSKKHGQLKQVAQKMVERAIEFLDGMQPAERLTLINTLRDVTEGKVRLTAPRPD